MPKLLFLLLIILLACKQDKKSAAFNKLSAINFIDTLISNRILDTQINMETGKYKPFYLGKKNDKIRIDYFLTNFKKESTHSNSFKQIDSLNTLLIIDTTIIIGTIIKYIPPPPNPYLLEDSNYVYDEKNDSIGNYSSYPVFIVNQTDQSIYVGSSENIPLILEAKDSLGVWKPIQKKYRFCDFQIPDLFLNANEILLTSCKLFSGSFETELRLVYEEKIYSNSFIGSINYSQFEKKEF